MKKVSSLSQEGRIIYPQIEIAANFRQRFWGLMGRKQLAEGSGLLLERCSGIHTCFMKFSIDAVYMERNFRVLDYETIRPWKLGSLIKGACHVLELPAGAGNRLKRGYPIALIPHNSAEDEYQ